MIELFPEANAWAALIAREAGGAGPMQEQALLGRALGEWRGRFRSELGLSGLRPVLGSGHQVAFWHPGILAKYVAVDALAGLLGLERVHVLVDQQTEGLDWFEAPQRLADGTLSVRRLEIDRPPRAFTAALPCVEAGVGRIFALLEVHRGAGDRLEQVARALADLMRPWVRQTLRVRASAMIDTSLGRAVLAEMARDPWACAAHYNAAVAEHPDAGIAPLIVRDDLVELPLWRVQASGQRIRAYDGDVQRWLEEPAVARLAPRALLLTALVRLGLCDLFVHGTGGARYDRAMERWVSAWLGARPAPSAVATATLVLPLGEGGAPPDDRAAAAAIAQRHRAWHDPESLAPSMRLEPGPGRAKRELLARVLGAPRLSRERRERFRTMHGTLERLRAENGPALEAAARRAATIVRRWRERPIVERRTWPFPLYEPAAIDAMAGAIRAAFAGARAGPVPAP